MRKNMSNNSVAPLDENTILKASTLVIVFFLFPPITILSLHHNMQKRYLSGAIRADTNIESLNIGDCFFFTNTRPGIKIACPLSDFRKLIMMTWVH